MDSVVAFSIPIFVCFKLRNTVLLLKYIFNYQVAFVYDIFAVQCMKAIHTSSAVSLFFFNSSALIPGNNIAPYVMLTPSGCTETMTNPPAPRTALGMWHFRV